MRELRASARRARRRRARERAGAQLTALTRQATERARTPSAPRASATCSRLALALAAHDPERTLARGYALVEDRAGEALGSAAAARAAHDVRLRFHDGAVDAEVSR